MNRIASFPTLKLHQVYLVKLPSYAMAAITNPMRMISAAKIIPEDGIDGIPPLLFSHRTRQWNFLPPLFFSTEAKVKVPPPTLPIYSRHFLLTPSLKLGTDKLANSIDGNYNGRHCRGR